MAMADEEKGFEVKDRRAFTQEGDMNPDAAKDEETKRSAPEEGEASGQAPDEGTEKADTGGRVLPPVDFPSFILSLSHAALLHMGQVPDPTTGEARQDLSLARHTIDTLGMLQEKTKGNLSEDEKNLIDNILTELRLAFVRLNT